MTSDGPSVIDIIKSNHQNLRRPNDLKIKILGHLRQPDITSFGLNILEKNSESGIISRFHRQEKIKTIENRHRIKDGSLVLLRDPSERDGITHACASSTGRTTQPYLLTLQGTCFFNEKGNSSSQLPLICQFPTGNTPTKLRFEFPKKTPTKNSHSKS